MAVGYHQLFNQSEHDRQEALTAYEDTIQCWSRTVEIRNYETEGHAQRSLELVLQIAKVVGIPQSSFAHIRYGVLLHDLGELGIPETILHKAGPLSEEEWNLMRQHPVYAYELLSTVPYLQPSLDIPYCHHEKWDGTGYPRGLKGEESPLTARIFAVVDVWDVLRSPRSYRPPWSVKDARVYIKEQAGTHFDPEIVNVFLETMDNVVSN
jgi:HD-GYP domain-containing protein (c-di-GMP phosphodiesterase class II)